MSRKIVSTEKAPSALGPYSQGVISGDIVYCSGQIGLEPRTMEFAGDTVEEQTKQVMENLGAVLKAAGSGFPNVIKCSIFLANMDDFGKVNEIYGKYFGEDPPARETVAVKTLPKNCYIEISCMAELN